MSQTNLNLIQVVLANNDCDLKRGFNAKGLFRKKKVDTYREDKKYDFSGERKKLDFTHRKKNSYTHRK